MMILYILAKYEEQDHGAKLNWRALIEGGIFEFMHRIIFNGYQAAYLPRADACGTGAS